MNLDSIVQNPKRARWVVLFVTAVVILMFTAFLYNLSWTTPLKSAPWKLGVGIACFVIILTSLGLVFWRLLREMRVTQTQGDWLDRLSHEFRTPLSTLSLVSDMLQDSARNPERDAELWQAHRTELERLTLEVEMLLKAVRLRSAKFKVATQWIQPNDWLKAHESAWLKQLGEGASLIITGPLLPSIELDSALLELIFDNLIRNSKSFQRVRLLFTLKQELNVPVSCVSAPDAGAFASAITASVLIRKGKANCFADSPACIPVFRARVWVCTFARMPQRRWVFVFVVRARAADRALVLH